MSRARRRTSGKLGKDWAESDFNEKTAKLTPRESQRLAALLTGYGGIRLHSTHDGCVVVSIEYEGVEIEVIREYAGEIIDHWVTPLGIRDAVRRFAANQL